MAVNRGVIGEGARYMEGVRRRLTTILAMDVEGYSRLMSVDEEATLLTLRAYREIIDAMIARHEGRIFNTGGDSVLAEFASAVEAVRCAISIQEELLVRNAELDDDRQLRFRIGVNVGDVMIEDGDLFGDGVNVAARLEGVAPVGGICISGSVFEQVKNKLSMGFEDIGPQQVKNIAEPVPAFCLVPAAVKVASGGEAARPAGWRGSNRILLLAVAAFVIVAVVGGAFWGLFLRLPAGPSGVEALMSGATIEGVSQRSDRPWTIRLLDEGVADMVMRSSPDGTRKGFRETGKWWVKNENFCMQFVKFGQGRLLCPNIAEEGGKIIPYRPSTGKPNGWTITK